MTEMIPSPSVLEQAPVQPDHLNYQPDIAGLPGAGEPPVERMIENLEAVASRLRALTAQFDQQRDARAVFAFVYTELTLALVRAVQADIFEDAVWVDQLAGRFADYFFQALESDEAETEVSVVWRWAFDLIDARPSPLSIWRYPSVLETLIISILVHIIHDLPLALVDLQFDDAGRPAHIADFHRTNDILEQAIDGLQDKVAARYDPSLRWFDRWLGEDYDEILTSYTLRLSRGMAWYNATRLVHTAGSYQKTPRESIQSATFKGIDIVRRPASRWVRMVLGVYRVFSWFFRRWPAG